MKITLLIAAVAISKISGVNAVCGSNVPLCNAAPLVLDNSICMDQTIPFALEPCCSSDSLAANDCPRAPVETCRIIELNTPFSNSVDSCCAELELSLEWKQTPISCCRTCSCFGDPHCVSFNSEVDSWIICDGRVKNPGAVYGKELYCPIKENACEAQLDQLGKQCVYEPNGKEAADENGSPCKSKSPPATLLMYKVDNFELLLYLGDRAVISSLKLTNGDQTYYLNAGPCVNQNMPWRDSPNAPNPPADPNWLPYKWTVTSGAAGRKWAIGGLETGIEIELRCLATGTVPRINIDALEDPKNSRPNEEGVCVTGVIDKQLSTYQHTYDVNPFCRATQTEGEAIDYFCDVSMIKTPQKCMKIICNSITDTAAESTQCVASMIKYRNDPEYKDGWERVWCAYNVLASKDPAECTAGKCLECMYDVYDFGWANAVKNWKNYNEGEGAGPVGGNLPCLHLSELNTTLDDCQDGVTIQYLDTEGLDADGDRVDCWHDFKAIPAGRTICEGKITMSAISETNPDEKNFFQRQIRLKQCNNRAALCKGAIVNECTPELGVSGSLKLTPYPVTNRSTLYWQLVREGKLVCTDGTLNCLKSEYPGGQFDKAVCTACDYCPTV